MRACGHSGMRQLQPSFAVSRFSLVALLGLLAAMPAAAASKNGFSLDVALVPSEQILHGGPDRDGIPSLDDPVFVPASNADFLDPDDRVLGVAIGSSARAYPVRILNYHEIVNDVLGSEAIVVTYCPLCGSGMAFSATVDGRRLDFGVSGLLYNSDVLLYDRQTESLWSQIAKTALTGAMKGTKLDAIPLSHTSWRDWLARHPDTDVLSMNTGYFRTYRVSPYGNYVSNSRLYFPVAAEDPRYERKAIVLGLEIDGRYKAYPFDELRRGPARFADEFNGRRFEVMFDAINETARIVHADGDELPTLIAFWFAWYAFHPGTAVYTAAGD